MRIHCIIYIEVSHCVKKRKYLSKIRGFYHTESLIKIIYGMRRSGKSVILTQIIDELKEIGINEQNIIC